MGGIVGGYFREQGVRRGVTGLGSAQETAGVGSDLRSRHGEGIEGTYWVAWEELY